MATRKDKVKKVSAPKAPSAPKLNGKARKAARKVGATEDTSETTPAKLSRIAALGEAALGKIGVKSKKAAEPARQFPALLGRVSYFSTEDPKAFLAIDWRAWVRPLSSGVQTDEGLIVDETFPLDCPSLDVLFEAVALRAELKAPLSRTTQEPGTWSACVVKGETVPYFCKALPTGFYVVKGEAYVSRIPSGKRWESAIQLDASVFEDLGCDPELLTKEGISDLRGLNGS